MEKSNVISVVSPVACLMCVCIHLYPVMRFVTSYFVEHCFILDSLNRDCVWNNLDHSQYFDDVFTNDSCLEDRTMI